MPIQEASIRDEPQERRAGPPRARASRGGGAPAATAATAATERDGDCDQGDRVTAEPSLNEIAGSSFQRTIKDALDEERATKNSLEARGIGIRDEFGRALDAAVRSARFDSRHKLSIALADGERREMALIAAVVLFATAALLGLAANFPGDYREAAVDRLAMPVTEEEWFKKQAADAARRDATINVDIIRTARMVNKTKARAVQWGYCI